MPRLKDKYKEDIVPALCETFDYKNVHQAPNVEKVVVNVGLGEALDNAKALEAVGALMASGQIKALSCAHKKGIVGEKLVALYEHCQKDPWRMAVVLERKKPFDDIPPEQLGLFSTESV